VAAGEEVLLINIGGGSGLFVCHPAAWGETAPVSIFFAISGQSGLFGVPLLAGKVSILWTIAKSHEREDLE
jgi:hypothetical protein